MTMNPKRVRIALFYAVTALYWASVYAYVPVLSVHSTNLGASPELLGVILGSYGFTQMLLRVPLGILSDKISKRKLFVVIGTVLGVVSSLGLWLSTTPLMLLIFRALAGAAASSWVTFTVLFSSYFDADSAPQAMSRLTVFNNLGQLTAMVLGGWMAQWMGNGASCLLAVGFGLCAIALSLGVTENAPINPKPLRIGALFSVALNKKLLAVSLVAVFYQIINQGAAMGFTPKYGDAIGLSSSQLGYLTSIVVLGMMISSYIGRYAAPKLGAKKCILTGQLVTTLATVCIPLLARDMWSLYTFQFIAGLGNGFTYPMLMGLAISEISMEKRGAAMGFFQSIYGLGMFVGPLLTGFLSARFTLPVSLALVGSLGIVAFVLTLCAVPGQRKAHAL